VWVWRDFGGGWRVYQEFLEGNKEGKSIEEKIEGAFEKGQERKGGFLQQKKSTMTV